MDNGEFEQSAWMARGSVLQRCVDMEQLIDLFLVNHFTSDPVKSDELWCLILAPRMILMGKKEVMVFLIVAHYPDFLKKYEGFAKAITTVIEERNIFAHYPFDNSQKGIENYNNSKVLTIMKIKNQDKNLLGTRELNNEYLNMLCKSVYDICDALKYLIGLQKTTHPPENL